jgi:hypothetical protein
MPIKDPEARRAYHREYMRAWYQTHRKEHLAYTLRVNRRARAAVRELVAGLKSQPCADCGGRFPPFVMDFDHVRGKKLGLISRMSTGRMSAAKILAEIDKCEVVCATCHRIRTQLRLLGRDIQPSEIVRVLGPNYVSVVMYA